MKQNYKLKNMKKLLLLCLLFISFSAAAQTHMTYYAYKLYYDLTAIEKPANFQEMKLKSDVVLDVYSTNGKMNGIYRIKIANGFNDRFTLSNCKHISDGWLIYESLDENTNTYMYTKIKQDEDANKLYIMLLYKNVSYCYEINIE